MILWSGYFQASQMQLEDDWIKLLVRKTYAHLQQKMHLHMLSWISLWTSQTAELFSIDYNRNTAAWLAYRPSREFPHIDVLLCILKDNR